MDRHAHSGCSLHRALYKADTVAELGGKQGKKRNARRRGCLYFCCCGWFFYLIYDLFEHLLLYGIALLEAHTATTQQLASADEKLS